MNQTKYMLQTHQQGQNRNINTANRTSENAAKFECLVTTLTNQSSVYEDIKSKLPLGNACYHSVQNVLLSASCLFLSSVSIFPLINTSRAMRELRYRFANKRMAILM